MSKQSVLFVCLGNICRSPMAEGVFREKLVRAGLEEFVDVDSCGTAGWHVGKLPHPESISTTASHGIDITMQRSRQLTVEDTNRFDWVVVMDRSNERDVRAINPQASVHRMLSFSTGEVPVDVPDPYFEGGFPGVFALISDACEGLLSKVQEAL